jgi:hypothetical protein
MQYIKDRIESFDNYFPYRKKNKCRLNHIKQWIKLFVYQHNKGIISLFNRAGIIIYHLKSMLLR